MSTSPDRFAQALRERLNFLCRERTQAEIARKTGASPNNVSRYARSTRMPLEFGSALVADVGVNPAWLLVGEGQPFLADVAADTGKTAANLLELVQAMAAISRMRLGALAGKQHAQMLRELDDALRRYEKLRDELNAQSRPVFERLLSDYKVTIQQRKLARADELRRAAEQVSRLCLDDGLRGEFDTLQALHERVLSHFGRAADTQRRIFLRYLGSGNSLKPESCLEAQNYAGSLWYLGRVREARAVCRACLALVEDAGRDWPEYAFLNATCGMMELDLGLHRMALSRIERSVPRMNAKHREFAGLGFLTRAQLLSGHVSIAQALQDAPHSRTKATTILRFAAWREDKAALDAAIAALIGDAEGRIPPTDPDILQHLALSAALRGDANALARLQTQRSELTKSGEIGLRVEFSNAVSLAQVARVSGQLKAAQTHTQASRELLARMGRTITPSVESLALHWRNVLGLTKAGAAPAKEVRKARRWFKHMARLGYACLAL